MKQKFDTYTLIIGDMEFIDTAPAVGGAQMCIIHKIDAVNYFDNEDAAEEAGEESGRDWIIPELYNGELDVPAMNEGIDLEDAVNVKMKALAASIKARASR